MHLHPGASENDRDGIERLCRYGVLGPVTLWKLTRDDNDTCVSKMNRTIRSNDELILTGQELTRRRALLLPPPTVHLVRFHGLFVSCTAREGE